MDRRLPRMDLNTRASYHYTLCGWDTISDIPLTNLPTSARSDMGVDIRIQIASGYSPAVEKKLVRGVLEHTGKGWLSRTLRSSGADKSRFGLLRGRPGSSKVREHPALSGLRAHPSDAHHLRFAEQRALGRKVSDEFTVPLCRLHHRERHQRGDELTWWQHLNVDPLDTAKRALASNSPRLGSSSRADRPRLRLLPCT
jgi:hypothetical protein